LPSGAKAGNDGSKDRTWCAGIGDIMPDIGMRQVEAAGVSRHEISALGHGQRHDADGWIGDAADQRAVVLLDRKEIDHRTGDLHRDPVGVEFDQRRQAILRQEFVAHHRIS
jgi:hypothetical protein